MNVDREFRNRRTTAFCRRTVMLDELCEIVDTRLHTDSPFLRRRTPRSTGQRHVAKRSGGVRGCPGDEEDIALVPVLGESSVSVFMHGCANHDGAVLAAAYATSETMRSRSTTSAASVCHRTARSANIAPHAHVSGRVVQAAKAIMPRADSGR